MADTLDLLTLAEAKTALNMSGSTHDTELALWITGVSRRIDILCGAVVVRTVTDEVHDGGRPHIDPEFAPCSTSSATTITTVKEYASTTLTTLTEETNASKPAQAFLFDPSIGRIYRRAGGVDSRFAVGRRNVLVTYEAGRYATTAAVGETFKLASGAILRRLWQREQGAWAAGSDPFEVPAGGSGFFKAVDPMVREWLSDELKAEVVG